MSRRIAALGAVGFLLAGCTGPVKAPEPTASGSDAILESREALGEPMVALGEAVIALAGGIDAARHDVPRGEDMAAQVKRLPTLQEEVGEAAGVAAAAAEEAPVEAAATIVTAAAEQAESAAVAADAEIEFLTQITAIDVALLDAAAEWDRPGSQSEIRARLDTLAGKVGKLRGALGKVQPAPARCAQMKRNRGDWISTVRQRTVELQGQANSAGGATFDRLRSSYRALPLAVEPRTADKADRNCWADASTVAAAAQEMRDAVERLRESLSR